MNLRIQYYFYFTTIVMTFHFNVNFVNTATHYDDSSELARRRLPATDNEPATGRRYVSEHELAEFLFQNYSNDCRPRRDASREVAVTIGITLYALNEIVERTHEIIVTASMVVLWWDEFLRWNNVPPYSQIELFASPSRKIWLPDIALTNSGDLYAFMLSRGMMAVIHSDGAVEYFPEATIKAFCQFDLTYFPFDQQLCEFRFESWSYIVEQQTFHLINKPINTERYSVNEQWHLFDTSATLYTTCYNYTTTSALCYPGAVFKLFLRRKSGYYVIMIIVPSIIFSAVELVAFSLPLVEVSKLQITFTCLLSYTVFQTTVQSDLPRTSEHDPLLSIYIDLQMAYIAFALVGEAIVFLSLQRAFKTKKAPLWLTKLLMIPSGDNRNAIKRDTTVENNSLILSGTGQQRQSMAYRHPSRINITSSSSPNITVNITDDDGGVHLRTLQQNGVIKEEYDNISENNHNISNSCQEFIRNYPLRDALVAQQMLTATSDMVVVDNEAAAAASRINIVGLPRVERLKWELIAGRVETLVAAVYMAAIIFTPIFMFFLLRLFEQNEGTIQ